jgi:Ca-activated chloride channel family protein
MTFTVQADRALVRATGGSRRYMLARITAPSAPARDSRIPVNIGIVLDRSGSMGDARKFDLARDAVEHALRMLQPADRFTLVVYDERVDVLMPSSRATPEATRRALDALDRIGPRGSTDLAAGWLAGCEQVAMYLGRERVSRCLLLSDGLANRGITDRQQLGMRAAEFRERGVVTSTFGVGADFDELLLRDMAHEGGGNSWFIEGASQIPGILTAELGEALEVTMRGTVMTVSLPPGCLARPINRFRYSTVGTRECAIVLGDLVSGQELDVVIEMRFPAVAVGQQVSTELVIGSVETGPVEPNGPVTWTGASHEANDEQPRNVEVDRAVAAQFAAQARAEATEANREGDLEGARRVLERTASRIESYAGNDRELLGLVQALRDEVRTYAEGRMSPMALKMSFYVAESTAKGRDSQGRARRR